MVVAGNHLCRGRVVGMRDLYDLARHAALHIALEVVACAVAAQRGAFGAIPALAGKAMSVLETSQGASSARGNSQRTASKSKPGGPTHHTPMCDRAWYTPYGERRPGKWGPRYKCGTNAT